MKRTRKIERLCELELDVSNEDIGTQICVTKLDDEIDIYQKLKAVSDAYDPPLVKRISDLASYAKKIWNNAEVYTVNNESFLGFIAFYANDHKSKIAYITQIAVLSHAQKRGLGKILLDLCVDISKGYGMSFLKLEVQKNNEKAIRFYRKYGFVFCGETSIKSMFMIKKI